MKKTFLILLALIIAGGSAFAGSKEVNHTKTITISWQRLVDEKGQTCERCASTEEELQKAFQSLKQSLTPLRIEVILEKKALNPTTCAKDISQTNRIWVGERTLEEWVGAQVGKSPCGFCCEELGDSVECRTIIFEGKTYETIPANLIIKASLLAASQLLTVGPDTPSCGDKSQTKKPSGCCPNEH